MVWWNIKEMILQHPTTKWPGKKIGHLQNGSPRTGVATKLPIVYAQEIDGALKFLPYKIGVVSNSILTKQYQISGQILRQSALLYGNISARVILW